MNIKKIIQAVSEAKKASKKRNFNQTVDLIVTLKNLDLSKAVEQVDFYAHLHQDKGKKTKICAIVGPELKAKASAVFETIIVDDQFETYKKNPKKLKKITKDHGFFVAQGNLMPKVAATFGKVLGPRGKMPNPKAGCVVDIKTDLKALYENLQKLVRVSAKAQPHIQCMAGVQNQEDNIIADNIQTIYEQILHHLTNGEHNVNRVFVKLTMGPPVGVK